MIPWYRLFGMVLTDFVTGTGWQVEMELDLSVKPQWLDLVLLRRGDGPEPAVWPDGFSPLANHNLITYKSLHKPLDAWALKELLAHAVNYRKQISPTVDDLVPESEIRLMAVATRFPDNLARVVAAPPGTRRL